MGGGGGGVKIAFMPWPMGEGIGQRLGSLSEQLRGSQSIFETALPRSTVNATVHSETNYP